MSEKKQTKKSDSEQSDDFLAEFDPEAIKKSASMDIKPILSIDDLGVENGKDVEILSEPYKVQIPENKAKGNPNIWVIDVLYKGIEHQFYAEAGSFRYQLGVLAEKLKTKTYTGLNIKIWKELGIVKKFGEVELYKVSLL